MNESVGSCDTIRGNRKLQMDIILHQPDEQRRTHRRNFEMDRKEGGGLMENYFEGSSSYQGQK